MYLFNFAQMNFVHFNDKNIENFDSFGDCTQMNQSLLKNTLACNFM